MNIWHDIDPALITPDRFMAVIEIKRGGKNKYEMDKATGMLRLDRVLYTSTHYPANYGFIPRTYADDGDPLDVLVLCSEAIEPMTLVECRPIGMFEMNDGDARDEKIIAVPLGDPNYNYMFDISFQNTCSTKSVISLRFIKSWKGVQRLSAKRRIVKSPIALSSSASIITVNPSGRRIKTKRTRMKTKRGNVHESSDYWHFRFAQCRGSTDVCP